MMAESNWVNNTEAIMVAELGQEEYQARLKKQDQLFQKAVEKGNVFDSLSVGWKTSRLKALFKVATITTGKRGTHPVGVGAQGFARVPSDVDIPDNDFFNPGRLFEVRMRHSNFPDATDDTKPNVRSLSIKFSDHEWESPLDLICHTGPLSPFFNADSIFDLLAGLKGGTETTKPYLLSLPIYLDAQIQGIRRMPDSYYHQHFYAQTVYDFKCKDGKPRLAKFRIVPSDGSSESGVMTTEEQKEAWNMEAPTETTKEKDYLKEEFSERLKQGHVQYTLQVQIHAFAEGPEHDMYNASSAWSDSDHPWKDLMNITLTSQLPVDVIEVTRFNIGNHSKKDLGIPDAKTQYDFNVVPQMRMEVYSAASSLRPHEPKEFEGETVEYGITVFTGNKKGAGTDANVSISLVGTTSRTSFRRLDYLLRDDFEQGISKVYTIKDKDIGDLLCVKVHLESTGKEKNDWYLTYITVVSGGDDKEKKTHIFPFYRWMTKSVTLVTAREGTASLPQTDVHPYIKLQRELEIQDRQRLYQWRKKGLDPGLEKYPGYIAAGDDSGALPRDAQFDEEKNLEIEYMKIISKKNAVFGIIKNTFGEIVRNIRGEDAIHEKKNLLSSVIDKTATLKHIMEHWDSDEEFGRQLLQGVNPVMLLRVETLPEHFPVTEEMLEGALDEGKSLADEIAAGKVYMVSYPELEDFTSIRNGQERFLCAPMCLLYVRQNQLVPVAIQLVQKPSGDTPIFTKKDDNGKYSDWLIAKMWVRVADTNIHQLATHLMGTHLQMEPVAIAILRNLPSMHPLYKLMIPHIRFVMAINTLGRKVLIPHGTAISLILAIAESPGVHVEFMEKIYEKFTLASLDIPKGFESRGVRDKTQLPGYYYRDDSLILWDAIKRFVSTILGVYYKTDEDIAADTELTKMMTDLQANGFHENVGAPSSFKAKEELIHFLTSIIFCCSCQHAAVNFGQLDYYAFAPNAPPCLMMPPPTTKNPEGLDDETMKRLLPTHEISQRFIGVANLLSLFSETELFLGDYPDKHFTDPEALSAIEQFQAHLKEVSEIIKLRNESLPVPYEYLLPEKVPNSIAI